MTTKEKALPIVPGSLRDAPALIEKLLPAQKLSIEVYKERMASHGQTLVSLGGFWKGRKPLILNKACILGALLPATDDLHRDLEIFEMLMAMDEESLRARMREKNSAESREFLAEHQHFSRASPYRDWAALACRPEECEEGLFEHVWGAVNAHLGTNAHSFPELVEQLGIMRFGHRPRVADSFSGSGQIPYEAARLGCDAIASDLNPIACLLTWGAFNIVGAPKERRDALRQEQQALVNRVQARIDALGVETDGHGAQAKVFLYCLEATCPETGWSVPLLPKLIVSNGLAAVAELVPDPANKRYDIRIVSGVSKERLASAEVGTIQNGAMVHTVNGRTYRTRISTLRGDHTDAEGNTRNRLRLWDKTDFMPKKDDIFRERLFAIQWLVSRRENGREKVVSEFRAVTSEDLEREGLVSSHVAKNLAEWQRLGWTPDVEIEAGAKTDEPIRTRGWTYWHHFFNPRQLLTTALINEESAEAPELKSSFLQVLNNNCRSTRWRYQAGGGGGTAGVFDNQALNTLYNYPTRGMASLKPLLLTEHYSYPVVGSVSLFTCPANQIDYDADLFITDPPYGDAVKYEEIFEFFIAWLRKNPPREFSSWVWDSRRALAIKGEDDDFRQGMIAAYRRMAEHMPDNGLQIVMFTHQSGSIWADMAHIVWAAGLQVTAAWYVVTEVEKRIQEQASYVKGTVLLVLRKRQGHYKSSRGDLGFEIQEEVEEQVRTLTGLNQEARDLYRDENLFSDADLQMAGYAAALRVLTRYAVIDGRDMAQEAQRPRVAGQTTLVEELIDFAVTVANQALVPGGLEKSHWDPLRPAERFYLKMLELEAQGAKTLDNYQNFAKAFKVRNFRAFLASDRANSARLKSARELGRSEMGETSEFYSTPLRALLYALMELQQDRDGDEVLVHLAHNYPEYFNRRDLLVALADYLARQIEPLRAEEASAARVLRDLIRNQRL